MVQVSEVAGGNSLSIPRAYWSLALIPVQEWIAEARRSLLLWAEAGPRSELSHDEANEY